MNEGLRSVSRGSPSLASGKGLVLGARAPRQGVAGRWRARWTAASGLTSSLLPPCAQALWPPSLAQTVPTRTAAQGFCMGSFLYHVALAFQYPEGLLPHFWSVVRCHLIKQGFGASVYKITTLSSLPYFIFHHSLWPPDRNISVYCVFSYRCVCVPREYIVYCSVPSVWHRVRTE